MNGIERRVVYRQPFWRYWALSVSGSGGDLLGSREKKLTNARTGLGYDRLYIGTCDWVELIYLFKCFSYFNFVVTFLA